MTGQVGILVHLKHPAKHLEIPMVLHVNNCVYMMLLFYTSVALQPFHFPLSMYIYIIILYHCVCVMSV